MTTNPLCRMFLFAVCWLGGVLLFGIKPVWAQPAYYSPPRTEVQIESVLKKASAKKNGASIHQTACFALEFGRIGNTKRQKELTDAAIAQIDSLKDDVRKARELLELASMFRSEGDMESMIDVPKNERATVDPTLIDQWIDKAAESILKIDDDPKTPEGKKRLREKKFLLDELTRQYAFSKRPEEIVRVADTYPDAKAIDLPDSEDWQKEYGTYGGKPFREGAIQQAALLYVQNGELDRAKKLVHDKMRPKDAADTLRYFPDYLVPQGKIDEAAAVLLEAAETTQTVQPDPLRQDLLMQIDSVMRQYNLFDTIIESAKFYSDPVFRDHPERLVARVLCAPPGSRSEKAVAKVLENTTPDDTAWWRAKTADAILKHRQDAATLKTALTELLMKSLDTKEKTPKTPTEPGEMEGPTDQIIDTATRSGYGREVLDAVLSIQAVPSQTAPAQATRVRQAKMLALFSAVMMSMQTGKFEEHLPLFQNFPTYFTEYDLEDPKELMVLDYVASLLAETGDAEHLNPLLLQMEKSGEKIVDPEWKDSFRCMIASKQAQSGQTETAFVSAKQILDPSQQGRGLVQVANSHYRYFPQWQWPKEMQGEAGMRHYDSTKTRTQPKPEDVQKTVNLIVDYVASIKDKNRQQAVLTAVARGLWSYVSPANANRDWNCASIFIDTLRKTDAFPAEVKAEYIKLLDEKHQ